MRTLASIQRIAELNPIPNADAIEVANVLGWHVVVKKGEFQVGNYCVYIGGSLGRSKLQRRYVQVLSPQILENYFWKLFKL